MPMLFNTDPVKSFREHVWVSPYYEDDITELKRLIGADRILFGSDFPHAEGLGQPMAFVEDLEGLSAGDIRLIMRENGYESSRPPLRTATVSRPLIKIAPRVALGADLGAPAHMGRLVR